jgi:hypothetical protein
MTNPFRRVPHRTTAPQSTLRHHRLLFAALVLLGALGLSTGVAAQQPVAVQQSTTVQQTTTASGSTTGPGSQQISQRRDNSATITNTGRSSTVTVSQTNGAQSSTTPPTDPASGPPMADRQTSVVQPPTAPSPSGATTGVSTQTTVIQRSTTPQGVSVTTAVVPAATGPTEAVQLLAGCSNVVLTWPTGTPLATVARAVDPPHALESIFKLDAAQGRYRGYSPTAPAFANDYTAVEAALEAVFVCVTQAATWHRPTS